MNRKLALTRLAAFLCCAALALGIPGMLERQAVWPAQAATVQTSPIGSATPAPEDSAAEVLDPEAGIERGGYLANQVAMCVICHSSRTQAGDVIAGKEFTGGNIPVKPTYAPTQAWAENAPNIRTLAAGDPEGVVQLLMTGKRGGRTPRAPMPPFRLSEADARAIVAYLKSL